MKKPWSISTTVRNPERVVQFLSTLKKLEGRKFDREAQTLFQTMLIQDKYYRPTTMASDQRECFDSGKPMKLDMAKKIFADQKYMDPAMRGGQSFAVLRKMGLCIGSTDATIRLSEMGNEFLSADSDMGDLFFNYFLKWQMPNPVERDFKEEDGFLIVPFIGTMHLIHRVNNLWENEGEKPVGISKKEFSLFVPTLIDYNEIENQAMRVIEYRNTPQTDKLEYERQFLIEFLGDNDPEKVGKLQQNLKDYGDNAIRYFRLTKYIRIRGGGFFVDLEPRRMIEISELLNSYVARPRNMTDETRYVEYLSDRQQPTLPWRTQDTLSRIKGYLENKISQKAKEMEKLQIPMPEIPDYEALKPEQQNDILKSHLLKLQNVQQYYDMGEPANITMCITALSNIRKTENKPSMELEKQAALSLMALNDAIKIKPNYPVGDDGEPTFTAPGGVSDLECYYEQFNMVCEVTLLSNRSQWVNEGQPVMRHLRKFERSNSDKASYCLFIAPSIHVDTVNTFWNAAKHGYEGHVQRIIPLNIKLFVRLLEILKKYKETKQAHLPHTELLKLYCGIADLVKTVESSDVWIKEIPNEINRWERCLLD